MTDDPAQQLVNHTWKPMLEITGADGLPPCDRAGNVLRASTSLYLSLRLPPTREAIDASDVLTKVLTADPPYGAHVSYPGRQALAGLGRTGIRAVVVGQPAARIDGNLRHAGLHLR